MSKKQYRYFGGLLQAQQCWLNRQSQKGWRLVKIGRLLYEFEASESGRFQYCIELIGQKSLAESKEYRSFLEDLGYRTFVKNINLNYSLGKARYRPWAEKGAKLATNGTTFNRELLIVEKINDGQPFILRTSYADQAKYYTVLRNMWLSPALLCLMGMALLFLKCGGWIGILIFGLLGCLMLIPAVQCHLKVQACHRQGLIEE